METTDHWRYTWKHTRITENCIRDGATQQIRGNGFCLLNSNKISLAFIGGESRTTAARRPTSTRYQLFSSLSSFDRRICVLFFLLLFFSFFFSSWNDSTEYFLFLFLIHAFYFWTQHIGRKQFTGRKAGRELVGFDLFLTYPPRCSVSSKSEAHYSWCL